MDPRVTDTFEDFSEAERMWSRERAAAPFAAFAAERLDVLEVQVQHLRDLARVTPAHYASDWMIQSAVDRQLELAIGTCLNLARHVAAEHGLREPASFAETFLILRDADLIDTSTADVMGRLCAFRHRLVHDHDGLSADVVIDVVRQRTADLARFGELVRGQLHRSRASRPGPARSLA